MNAVRRRNFYLPDDLMDSVKKLADQDGVSMTEILKTALQFYLDYRKRLARIARDAE